MNASSQPVAATQPPHTATPYAVDWSEHFGTAQVVGRMFDNHGLAVAECSGPNAKANAAFIARACNSQAALIAALESFIACELKGDAALYLEQAVAALKIAKGEAK